MLVLTCSVHGLLLSLGLAVVFVLLSTVPCGRRHTLSSMTSDQREPFALAGLAVIIEQHTPPSYASGERVSPFKVCPSCFCTLLKNL
jgi:hypothetical protein